MKVATAFVAAERRAGQIIDHGPSIASFDLSILDAIETVATGVSNNGAENSP